MAKGGTWAIGKPIPRAANRKSCLVTLVDRKSRMFLCRKAEKKAADCVSKTIIDMLKDLPHKSIISDQGCKFYNYEQISIGLNGMKLLFRAASTVADRERTRTPPSF